MENKKKYDILLAAKWEKWTELFVRHSYFSLKVSTNEQTVRRTKEQYAQKT